MFNSEYHKIQTIYKRDLKDMRKVIEGEFSLPEFEYLRNNTWIFTEKIDGTNIRIIYENGVFKFGGKTDNASIPVFLLHKLQSIFTDEKREVWESIFLDKETYKCSEEVCLYGEGYGAKIQKCGGNYIPDGVDFILFDIRVGNWWLKRENIENIAGELGLKCVPIVDAGTLYDAVKMVKYGFNSTFGNFLAEGIVARPEVELFMRNKGRIITKIKSRDF
jgi:hypothetical protein